MRNSEAHVAGTPGEPRRRAILTAAVGATVTAAVGCGGGPAGAGPWTPDTDTMVSWIEQVVARGVRRPGYEADVWTETFVADRFREFGLVDVRAEPVPVIRWEPVRWSLTVTPAGGEPVELDCFPLPYAAPVRGLDVELVRFDPADPAAVAGKAGLLDATLVRLAPDAVAEFGSVPDDLTGRVYDPAGTFAGDEHLLPFAAGLNRVADPVVDAGAAAFVGTLLDYPGDSCRYYVPYHGEPIPVPGVWINGSDGRWLHDQLARGPVRCRLDVESTSRPFESHNIVGDLPGPGEDIVLIGSHHDAPWASAVEDGTGIALVLAQAAYWASVPEQRRPHRMRFLLQGGHMYGGAGLETYVATHRAELDRVVLEVHLEHAALDVRAPDGSLEPTGHCIPRWFFTSTIPPLEQAVADALAAEDLRRSMVVAPDALGSNPPTDGAAYHEAGVPLVHFLSAPWYLFDEADRLDKVDRDNLLPLTRAVVRIVEATRSTTAAQMRAARVTRVVG